MVEKTSQKPEKFKQAVPFQKAASVLSYSSLEHCTMFCSAALQGVCEAVDVSLSWLFADVAWPSE